MDILRVSQIHTLSGPVYRMYFGVDQSMMQLLSLDRWCMMKSTSFKPADGFSRTKSAVNLRKSSGASLSSLFGVREKVSIPCEGRYSSKLKPKLLCL